MKKDWLLFADIILIILIGLTTLYSMVVGTETFLSRGGMMNRQLIIVIIGMAFYAFFCYLDYRFIGHPQVIIPVYVVALVLLVALFFLGVEINNATRWIVVGSFQIQPSEIAKISMILLTSWLFSLRSKYNVWVLAGVSFICVLVYVALIFVEPDAGTSISMLIMWFVIAFLVLPDQVRNLLIVIVTGLVSSSVLLALGGKLMVGAAVGLIAIGVGLLTFVLVSRAKVLIIIALLLGIVIAFGGRYMWTSVLHDYQRQRIETFINPSGDIQGAGFQVDQSKVAIGSGMILGKGFGQGTQSKLNFLPEHETDFVFAAYAEEFGLVGSLFLLMLYAFAIYRIFQTAEGADDDFGMIVCIGIGVKIMMEVVINVGMNIGMIPATGVPLPLISSGGSLFLITMIGLGLVQSVRIHTEDIGDNS